MSLFEVSGWSVPVDPVAESSSHSKKRKRASHDSDKPHFTDVSFEKFVKRLKGSRSEQVTSPSASTESKKEKKREKKNREKEHKREREREEKKKSISLPKPLKPFVAEQASRLSSAHPPKKPKVKRTSVQLTPPSLPSPTRQHDNAEELTELQKGMKQSLDGARFRLINEALYKSASHEARQVMRDPGVFEEYHAGFRQQVQSWPTNPVEHYISILSKYPSGTVVADLGCGDAALAKALIPLGFNVLSYDLVSDGTYVVEADICSRLPLPGSEGPEDKKTDGEGHVVDIVVCGLSLMGTNWPCCLGEAWRILRPSGRLYVAEVASRFTNMEQFQFLVGSIGFNLKNKDDNNTHFTLFEFVKVARQKLSEKDWSKILSKASVLKACEYKRR
ncbi:hypothetical protein AX17_000967 [Amanita inopinata Kibby_2008]|nr:hypothetical protein AX17_000967 [Amanita inopinata Kibby_2008]